MGGEGGWAGRREVDDRESFMGGQMCLARLVKVRGGEGGAKAGKREEKVVEVSSRGRGEREGREKVR